MKLLSTSQSVEIIKKKYPQFNYWMLLSAVDKGLLPARRRLAKKRPGKIWIEEADAKKFNPYPKV